jgi:dipeptidyl-peptidase-4
LSGKLLNTVTRHPFDVQGLVRIDDAAGTIYYTVLSGDTTYKRQLHRVELSGKNDKRLTDPTLNHAVSLSPDGKYFLDTAQSSTTPPITRLLDAAGKVVATVANTDAEQLKATGVAPGEVFTFKAADGKTDLYGKLYRPSNFDANKKYPLLVQVYAGPDTPGASEKLRTADPDHRTGISGRAVRRPWR